MSSFLEKLADGGHLTEEQVERIGLRVSEMVEAARQDPSFRKEAMEKLSISPFAKELGKRVGYGGALGAGATLAAAGVGAIADKLKERSESIAKAKNYQEMIKANPDLRGADVNAQMVQRHFNTIQKFNPEYASDPLVAGQYVRSSMNFAAPNLDQLNNVVRARQSYVSARKDDRAIPSGAGKLLDPMSSVATKLLGKASQ